MRAYLSDHFTLGSSSLLRCTTQTHECPRFFLVSALVTSILRSSLPYLNFVEVISLEHDQPGSTADSLFPIGLSDSAKWKLVFADVTHQLSEALKRQANWVIAELEVNPNKTQAQMEYRNRSVRVLGGYLAMARALFYYRLGLGAKPKYALLFGSYKYKVEVDQRNRGHCYYLFHQYEGEGRGELGPADRPFIEVIGLNVHLNGVAFTTEGLSPRLRAIRSRVERHYRYWRRSLIRMAINYVDRYSGGLYTSFSAWVLDYTF